MNDLMNDSFVGAAAAAANLNKKSEAEGEAGDESLHRFLDEAEAAKQEMGAIRDLLAQLKTLNEERKTLYKREALRSLSARINADMVQALRQARSVRSRLESLDGGPHSADRARSSVIAGLKTRLREIMIDFQDLRIKMSLEHREAVARCYYTITGENPSDEILEQIISSGERPEELLPKVVAEGDQAAAVVAVVHEMEDRQEAAREVERSLVELHQLFLDMSVIVESQGKQVDIIEQQVGSAGNDIEAAAQSLTEAKSQQTSARRTCVWIWVIVFVLLVLGVVAAIVVYVLNVNKKSLGVRSVGSYILDFSSF